MVNTTMSSYTVGCALKGKDHQLDRHFGTVAQR